MSYIELRYIKVKQPIGEFYISSIDYKQLIEIASADIRKIDEEADRNNSFDSYLGIQRTIMPKRITEISEYVNTVDATFPTSIILHIQSKEMFINEQPISEYDPEYIENNIDKITTVENININEENGTLQIRKDGSVARILDGQHRIEGLRQYLKQRKGDDTLFPDGEMSFDLNITIFVDLDIDDQAQIFSVINKAQTKVNKSLVYDLFEYAKYPSPQKTAHDVVRLLNRLESSPFYKKIKVLGTASNTETETIAQATFVELILGYITSDPTSDRDILRRNGLKKIFSGSPLKKITNPNEYKKYNSDSDIT